MIKATYAHINTTTQSVLTYQEVFATINDVPEHVYPYGKDVPMFLSDTQTATMVDAITLTSQHIDNGRTPNDVFTKLIEEVGELAQELLVLNGRSYKQPGSDGIIGEAIDAINCLVDLIYLIEPGINEQSLAFIAWTKQKKWLQNHKNSKIPRRSYREDPCPECDEGDLQPQSGGGVKCNKCSFWMCY